MQTPLHTQRVSFAQVDKSRERHVQNQKKAQLLKEFDLHVALPRSLMP
jgi:hypothetical protein